MSRPEQSMEARTGRVKQRYADDGSRLVAGVVAVSEDKKKVLVVGSTRRPNHWVLPKGGYETDEPTPQEAAEREAWEEAGITGRCTRDLGYIPDNRTERGKDSTKRSPIQKTLYQFFEFRVERECVEWPEMDKRKRVWMTYDEACRCFDDMKRPELKEALDRSDCEGSRHARKKAEEDKRKKDP